MKILLVLSYCGTNFCGYQVQGEKRTVQKTLQDAIEAVFAKRFDITGCSRTDAGVHAKEFVLCVDTDWQEEKIPMSQLPRALNTHLPPDVAVRHAQIVPDDFHVRYCEHEKEYEYRIWNAPYPDPFSHDFALFFPQKLDCEVMQKAANYLIGTHDFASFCAAGSKITDTVRTVRSFTVTKEGDTVLIRVRANGFLYHMVRIFVGTLIEVSRGLRTPESMQELLLARDRKQAGYTAPAQGLYLHRVYYAKSALLENEW